MVGPIRCKMDAIIFCYKTYLFGVSNCLGESFSYSKAASWFLYEKNHSESPTSHDTSRDYRFLLALVMQESSAAARNICCLCQEPRAMAIPGRKKTHVLACKNL